MCLYQYCFSPDFVQVVFEKTQDQVGSLSAVVAAATTAGDKSNEREQSLVIEELVQHLDTARTNLVLKTRECDNVQKELNCKNESQLQLNDELESLKHNILLLQDELVVLQRASFLSEQNMQTDMGSLKSELLTRIECVVSLENQLKIVHAKSEVKASQNTFLEQELGICRATINNLEDNMKEETENSSQKLQNENPQIQSSKHQLDVLHSGNEALDENIKQDQERMKRELNEATLKFDSLQQELTDLRNKSDVKTQQIETFKLQILRLTDYQMKSQIEYKDDLERLNIDINEKTRALDITQHKLDETLRNFAESEEILCADLEKVKGDLEEKEGMVEMKEQSVKSLTRELGDIQAAMEESNNSLKKQLDNSNAKLESQDQCAQSLELDNQSLKATIMKLESNEMEQAKIMKVKLETKNDQLNLAEQEMGRCNANVNSLKESLKEETTMSREKLQDKEAQIKALQVELEALQSGSRTLEEHIKQDHERMKQVLNEATTRYEILQQGVKKAASDGRNEIHIKNQHIDALQLKILKLTESMKECQNQHAFDMERLMITLDEKTQALQITQKKLDEAVHNFSESDNRYSTELAKAQADLTKKEITFKNVDEELAKRTTTIENLNVVVHEKSYIIEKQDLELQEKTSSLKQFEVQLQEIKNSQSISEDQIHAELKEKCLLVDELQLRVEQLDIVVENLRLELEEAGSAVDQPGLQELNVQLQKMKSAIAELEGDIQERNTVVEKQEAELLDKTMLMEDLKEQLQIQISLVERREIQEHMVNKSMEPITESTPNTTQELELLREELASESARVHSLEDALLMMKTGKASDENQLQEEREKLMAELEFKVTSLHIAQSELQKLQLASEASADKLLEFEKAKADLESQSAIVVTLQQELENLHSSKYVIQHSDHQHDRSGSEDKSSDVTQLQTEVNHLKASAKLYVEENEKLQADLKTRTNELDMLKHQSDELQVSTEREVYSSHTEVHKTLIQREIVETQQHQQPVNTSETQEAVTKLAHELQQRDQHILNLQQKLDEFMSPNNRNMDTTVTNDMLKRDIETKRLFINSLSKEKKTLEQQLVILDDASRGAQRLKENLTAKTIEVESLKQQLEEIRSENSTQHRDDIMEALQQEVQQHREKEEENEIQIQVVRDELQLVQTHEATLTNRVSDLTAVADKSKQECDVSISNVYTRSIHKWIYYTAIIEPLYKEPL